MTKIITQKYQNFEVNIIPALSNNYIYLLECFRSGKTICIDPGEFEAVDNFLTKQNLNLDFIIITHKHWDHVSGILKLKEKYNCKTIIFENDREIISGGDVFLTINDAPRKTILSEENNFKLGKITFTPFTTFGHCQNHISYFVKEENILFCGDTLFSSGCGRIFPDGSIEELFDSLNNKIAKLPLNTQIYCSHEYTLNNIKFALTLEPNNQDLLLKHKNCQDLRRQDQPTLPTKLKNELKTNPFLRSYSEEIRKNIGTKKGLDDLEVFKTIRSLKDRF